MCQWFPVTLGINQRYIKWNNHFSLQFHFEIIFFKNYKKSGVSDFSTLKSHDPEWKWLTLMWNFWSVSCFRYKFYIFQNMLHFLSKITAKIIIWKMVVSFYPDWFQNNWKSLAIFFLKMFWQSKNTNQFIF